MARRSAVRPSARSLSARRRAPNPLGADVRGDSSGCASAATATTWPPGARWSSAWRSGGPRHRGGVHRPAPHSADGSDGPHRRHGVAGLGPARGFFGCPEVRNLQRSTLWRYAVSAPGGTITALDPVDFVVTPGWYAFRPYRLRGAPSLAYAPRRAADSVLYQVVRDHYETFAAQAGGWRDGEGLPRFIDEEFRGFLRCGWLAGGFARFRCDGCGLDRLVPFSCKSRTVCPSCGGRRMAERAAHLVDHVFPDVPIRQWVLTVPHRLRYLLAWNHGLTRAVVGVFMHGVLDWLRRRARVEQGIADGRGGGVAIVQRFWGGAESQRPYPCVDRGRRVCQ